MNDHRGSGWRIAGCGLVADDFDGSRLGDLIEAGRLTARLGVHVEGVDDGGRALRGKFGDALGETPQIVHLRLGEQKIGVGPPFDALGGAHLDEAAARFEDFELIAMLDGGDVGRFGGEIFSKIEGGRAGIGDSSRGLLGRMRTAPGRRDPEDRDERARGTREYVRRLSGHAEDFLKLSKII